MKTRKRVLLLVLAAIALSILCLSLLSSHPPITLECDVPEAYLSAIRSQARGLYSTTFPLFAVRITVENYIDERVYYTIHYFPFGTVGMSYGPGEGYNQEKALTGLL